MAKTDHQDESQTASSTLSERASDWTQTAKDRFEKARAKASDGADTANRIITEHPLAAAAAAMVVGAALSYAFPRGRRAILKLAPLVADTVSNAIKESARVAQDAMPDRDQLMKPVEAATAAAAVVGEAARKAPAQVKKAAQSGVNAAKSAADRAQIAESASALAERASGAASLVAERLRKIVH